MAHVAKRVKKKAMIVVAVNSLPLTCPSYVLHYPARQLMSKRPDFYTLCEVLKVWKLSKMEILPGPLVSPHRANGCCRVYARPQALRTGLC